ncbi:MAG TPA: 3-hydroxyacyl-ACP dehydratase [Parafilimonas sp.]|nr:3-hydroxyacyl-ACP dehydratase [Parafilimonas sp.]
MIQHDILSLIPQRPPFVMIDELLMANEKGAASAFKVSEKNLFLKDGFLAEAALIENIAQTAAARIGYISLDEDKPAPLGYLAAVQNFEVFSLPKLNDEITTEIFIENVIFNVVIISGKIMCNKKNISTCNMKIFTSN